MCNPSSRTGGILSTSARQSAGTISFLSFPVCSGICSFFILAFLPPALALALAGLAPPAAAGAACSCAASSTPTIVIITDFSRTAMYGLFCALAHDSADCVVL